MKIKRDYSLNERLHFYMDTSFDAGGRNSGYLITTISMEHPFVTRNATGEEQTSVTIPLAAMAHQRKDRVTHQELIMVAAEKYKLDSLQTGSSICTDREYKGTRVWDNCKKVICWNHLKENIARKANKLGVNKHGQTEVKNDLHKILMSKTPDSFDRRRDRYFNDDNVGHEIWKDQRFQTYFLEHLDGDIRQFAGRWVLEEADIPNTRKGITNNRAESVNRLFNSIKDLKTKGGFPEVLLTYKELTTTAIREIRRAYHNASGDMKLKTDWNHLMQPENELPAMNFPTYKKMKKSLLKNSKYMREEDPLREGNTIPPDLDMDPLEAKLEDIMSDASWYAEHPNSWSLNQGDFSFRLAKKGMILGEANPATEVYTLTLNPASCTCPTGPACAHFVHLSNNFGGGIDKKRFLKLLKEKMTKRPKGSGKDYGSKQPRKYSGIDPKFATPSSGARQRLFSDTPTPTRRRPRLGIDTESSESDASEISSTQQSPSFKRFNFDDNDDEDDDDFDSKPQKPFPTGRSELAGPRPKLLAPSPLSKAKFYTKPSTGETFVSGHPSFNADADTTNFTPPIRVSSQLPATSGQEASPQKDGASRQSSAPTTMDSKSSRRNIYFRPNKKPDDVPFLRQEHRLFTTNIPPCVIDGGRIDIDVARQHLHMAKHIRLDTHQAAWLTHKGKYRTL